MCGCRDSRAGAGKVHKPETELYPAPNGFHGEEGSEGTEGTVQRLELEGRSVTGEIAWSSQKALSG